MFKPTMKVNLKFWQSSIVLVVVATALIGTTITFAKNANSGVLPPNSHPYGHTYGEWSNAWWQWVLSIPTDNNPLLDSTGADCAQGQSGRVWFLAGTLGGSAVRSCTIPAGKALFFPIANFVNTNLGCPPTTYTADQLHQQLNSNIAAVTPPEGTLEAQVDGVNIQDLQNYRAGPDNGTFSVTLPANNLFTSKSCVIPAGTYSSLVSDGYYLMLSPLPPGQHTIHFKAAAPSIQLALDVTYNLTVQPTKFHTDRK